MAVDADTREVLRCFALALRASGATHEEIGVYLGVSQTTAYKWVNPHYDLHTRQKQLRWQRTPIGKVTQALHSVRSKARTGGYATCSATTEQLLASLADSCAICGEPENRGSLCLDHCHKTGRFCGWLCHRCNRHLLGMSKDNPDLLRRAAAYLEGTQHEQHGA